MTWASQNLNILCSCLKQFEVLVSQFKQSICLGLAKNNASIQYLSDSLAFTIHHPLNQSLSFLQALHQEKASLSTHYGAITGLAELGQEVGENKFYKMSEKIQEN